MANLSDAAALSGVRCPSRSFLVRRGHCRYFALLLSESSSFSVQLLLRLLDILCQHEPLDMTAHTTFVVIKMQNDTH